MTGDDINCIWGFIGERAATSAWRQIETEFVVDKNSISWNGGIAGTVDDEFVAEWRDEAAGARLADLITDLPAEDHGTNGLTAFRPDMQTVIEHLAIMTNAAKRIAIANTVLLLAALPPMYPGGTDVSVEIIDDDYAHALSAIHAQYPDAFVYNEHQTVKRLIAAFPGPNKI